MLIELLTTPIFSLIGIIVNMIPDGFNIPNYVAYTFDILKYPLAIFPTDLWILVISNVAFWYMAQLTWGVVEWVYKKIPGVD